MTAAAPVDLVIAVPDRLDAAIEATVYFLVSEALTNVAKHAQAETIAAPIPRKDRASEGWSTASRPSVDAWMSAAQRRAGRAYARNYRRTRSGR